MLVRVISGIVGIIVLLLVMFLSQELFIGAISVICAIASYEVVTLVDKPEGRKVNDVVPKYIGFNIPNKFVVGFGLDYNELYRNLPYIGVLRKEVYSE